MASADRCGGDNYNSDNRHPVPRRKNRRTVPLRVFRFFLGSELPPSTRWRNRSVRHALRGPAHRNGGSQHELHLVIILGDHLTTPLRVKIDNNGGFEIERERILMPVEDN